MKIDKPLLLRRIFSSKNSLPATRGKLEKKAALTGHGLQHKLTLQQRVAIEFAQIDPLSEQVISQALKVYVRAILIEQFGEELISDPALGNLLADIVTTLPLHSQFQQLEQFITEILIKANKSSQEKI